MKWEYSEWAKLVLFQLGGLLGRGELFGIRSARDG